MEDCKMSSVRKEAWYREALQEGPISELEQRVRLGEMDALHQLGREYLRNKRLPTFSTDTWAIVLPYCIALVREGGEEEAWASDFMWKASRETGYLPAVPRSEIAYIPYGLAPKITISRGWEVQTEGSTQEGDVEDRGMVNAEGERISFNDPENPNPWTTHNFDLQVELDDLMDELDQEYSSHLYEGEGAFIKDLDREDAQEEFGETYHDEVWGDRVDDYHGESLATVIAGRFEIHIENPHHRERISAWLQERA
jgi:hypothetical protein